MTFQKESILPRQLYYAGIVLLMLPIVMVCVMAFYNFESTAGGEGFLSGFTELFTPLRMGELYKIIGRAFWISLLTTLISFSVSYVLVLYTSERFRMFFFIVLTLPFLANESVRVFSWQYVLSENGVFNGALSWITGSKVSFFNGSNAWNVLFAMIVTCIPFGVFINSGALQIIPESYWRSADDLNLNKLSKFLKIGVSMSKMSILASFVILFFIAFSLSAEVNFLGGDSKISTRNFILSLMSANKFQAVFALGFMLILIFCLFPLGYTLATSNRKDS